MLQLIPPLERFRHVSDDGLWQILFNVRDKCDFWERRDAFLSLLLRAESDRASYAFFLVEGALPSRLEELPSGFLLDFLYSPFPSESNKWKQRRGFLASLLVERNDLDALGWEDLACVAHAKKVRDAAWKRFAELADDELIQVVFRGLKRGTPGWKKLRLATLAKTVPAG